MFYLLKDIRARTADGFTVYQHIPDPWIIRLFIYLDKFLKGAGIPFIVRLFHSLFSHDNQQLFIIVFDFTFNLITQTRRPGKTLTAKIPPAKLRILIPAQVIASRIETSQSRQSESVALLICLDISACQKIGLHIPIAVLGILLNEAVFLQFHAYLRHIFKDRAPSLCALIFIYSIANIRNKLLAVSHFFPEGQYLHKQPLLLRKAVRYRAASDGRILRSGLVSPVIRLYGRRIVSLKYGKHVKILLLPVQGGKQIFEIRVRFNREIVQDQNHAVKTFSKHCLKFALTSVIPSPKKGSA